MRVVSCAETELPDAQVPPYLSGLSPENSEACRAFAAAYEKAVDSAHRRYNALRRMRGVSPLKHGHFLETSPDLNLLLAPSIVRYARAETLSPDTFTYLEGCVRQESPFEPPLMASRYEPLIYMSFGSLGAMDTALIDRMIKVFAAIPARFIVNVGGFADGYRNVPDNVFLGAWFPQPSVVAQADLFIHHGGNNSFCEALYYGVPSLLMPYCWDGFDNAQRAGATGTGQWLRRYDWTATELEDAVLSLLDDREMATRLQLASADMQKRPGAIKAAHAILEIARAASDMSLRT